MAGMQETDRLTLKNGITYLLKDAAAREQLASMLTEVMEKYSADNPPPYPVTSVNGQTGDVIVGGAVDSVNGQTGAVVLDANDVGALPNTTQIPSKTSDLANDSGFVNAAGAAAAAPVQSVNGQTGAVTVTVPTATSDLTNDSGFVDAAGAAAAAPVQRVNGQTGDVTVPGVTPLDVYPVGSIYMSVNSTNPGTLFGGTWEQLEDRFLLAAGTTYAAGATGGAETHHHSTANHTLTVSEMPSHTHGVQGWRYGHSSKQDNTALAYERLTGDAASTYTPILNAGGGSAHNHGNTGDTSNMPPYLAVYMWKRTA